MPLVRRLFPVVVVVMRMDVDSQHNLRKLPHLGQTSKLGRSCHIETNLMELAFVYFQCYYDAQHISLLLGIVSFSSVLFRFFVKSKESIICHGSCFMPGLTTTYLFGIFDTPLFSCEASTLSPHRVAVAFRNVFTVGFITRLILVSFASFNGRF